MTSTASKGSITQAYEQLVIIVSAMIATTFVALLEAGQFSNFSAALYWATITFTAVLPLQCVAWGEAYGGKQSAMLSVCFWLGGVGLWMGLALVTYHFSGYHLLAYIISSAISAALIIRRIRLETR